MRLDQEHLDFLARFAKTPDGQYLIRMLEARLKEAERMLRTTTGEEVHRWQGRALELDDWIERLHGRQALAKRPAPTDASRSQHWST